MDKYQGVRELPPSEVLAALGVDASKVKKRAGKEEWYSTCPQGHGGKSLVTCLPAVICVDIDHQERVDPVKFPSRPGAAARAVSLDWPL